MLQFTDRHSGEQRFVPGDRVVVISQDGDESTITVDSGKASLVFSAHESANELSLRMMA